MFFRRSVIAMISAFAGLAVAPEVPLAQTYPSRPVTLVVGFPAGGPNDILGRIIAQWLSGKLGQPFVVDNRPGNSGNIATEAVVRAAPDGYTILLVGPANAISGSLSDKLGFNFLTDIAAVGGITREALALLVHPSVPATTATELIALAKSKTGSLIMASTGAGSSPHVSGELFKMMTVIEMPVVHYAGGGPALKAMIAGQAHVMFEPMSAAIEPVKRGELRALAVTTSARAPALPDVPALGELVAGYEASAVTGIGAPRDTPPEIIATLNAAINAGFLDPAMVTRLAETGGVPLPGTPSDFAKLLAAETEKWGKVVKSAIVKP